MGGSHLPLGVVCIFRLGGSHLPLEWFASSAWMVCICAWGVPTTPQHTDSQPPFWGTRGNLGDTSGRGFLIIPDYWSKMNQIIGRQLTNFLYL